MIHGRGWVLFGAWAGMALAYGIGKSALPEAGLMIALPIVFGAAALGAILGQIARNVRE